MMMCTDTGLLATVADEHCFCLAINAISILECNFAVVNKRSSLSLQKVRMIFTTLLLLLYTTTIISAFSSSSSGKGFGASSSSNNAYVSPFDRFRSSCPADINDIRQFDPKLVKEDDMNHKDDVWVAVYRSANNLPSVFVRDEFFSAMKASTTAQEGDADTLVSSTKSISTSISEGSLISNNNNKPVAVARLFKDTTTNKYILDSMRCVLKKENTDEECDGGSEHAEAIGVCIDELVLSYLQKCIDDNDEKLSFDGGIHFRGTLVSGKLLDSRGFREVTELSLDMHSHESDFDGSLSKYAERATSRDVAKNPGALDRALKIVSYLGRIDRDEDRLKAKQQVNEDDGESDNDPWASVKKFY